MKEEATFPFRSQKHAALQDRWQLPTKWANLPPPPRVDTVHRRCQSPHCQTEAVITVTCSHLQAWIPMPGILAPLAENASYLEM